MPAFRVIPLCESESSGTHVSNGDNNPAGYTTLNGGHHGAAFGRNSGSDVGSNPGFAATNGNGIYPRSNGSEAGSNAPSDHWGLDANGLSNGLSNNANNSAAAAQPMLRRNQYWV